jgi:hypothetical protein
MRSHGSRSRRRQPYPVHGDADAGMDPDADGTVTS